MRLFTLLLAVLLGGCSFITQEDRQLADRTLQGAGAGCTYIEGSGGAGGMMAGVPVTGGFGSGKLAAARSNSGNARTHCGPDGAWVEVQSDEPIKIQIVPVDPASKPLSDSTKTLPAAITPGACPTCALVRDDWFTTF